MEDKKDKDAKVEFTGVSPFGQTVESNKIIGDAESPSQEDIAEMIRKQRPRTVKDVVSNLQPVLEQLSKDCPDEELTEEAAQALREAVAGVAKEVLGKIKK